MAEETPPSKTIPDIVAERSRGEQIGIWLLRRWWALAVLAGGAIISQFSNILTNAISQILHGQTPSLNDLQNSANGTIFARNPLLSSIFMGIAIILTAIAFVAERAEQGRLARIAEHEAVIEKEQQRAEVRVEVRQVVQEIFKNRSLDDEGDDDEAGATGAIKRSFVLPPRPTLVVGRDLELARVMTELARPNTTAIALRGMGGVGKSTLLAETLHRVAGNQFKDGVVWIACNDLEGEEGASRLYDSVGIALGNGEVTQTPDIGSKAVALRKAIAGNHILFALDNVEALLPLEDVIATLTARGSDGVGGEILLSTRVSWPDITNLTEIDLDSLSTDQGLALLKTLVARTSTGISNDDEANARAIVEAVGALPLALELVAPRIARRTEPLASLAGRLHEEGVQLKGRTKGIERTFNITYSQLEPDQQTAFVALAVFTGPEFGQDAAMTAVRSLLNKEDASPHLLIDLADLSLLRVVPQAEGAPRYQLHPLLQQFARERLRARDSTDDIKLHRVVARYYQQYMHEKARKNRYSAHDIELEFMNALGSLTWMHDRTNLPDEAGKEAQEIVGDIGSSLRAFIMDRGYWTDGRRILQWAADANVQIGNARRASTILSALGFISRQQGDFDTAERCYKRGLELARSANDKRAEAARIHSMGTLAMNRGKLDDARAYYEEALAARRRMRDDGGISSTLRSLGILATERGNWDEARTYLGEALSIKANAGASRARTLCELAAVNIRDPQGDKIRARQYLDESLSVAQRMHLQFDTAHTLDLIGALDLEENKLDDARTHWKEALALYTQLGSSQAARTSALLARITPNPVATNR